jgi:hypothetical protein
MRTDPFKDRQVSGYSGLLPGETHEERNSRQEREQNEFLLGKFRLPLPEWTKQEELHDILQREHRTDRWEDSQERLRLIKRFVHMHDRDVPEWANYDVVVRAPDIEDEWFYHPSDPTVIPRHSEVAEYQIFLRIKWLYYEHAVGYDEFDWDILADPATLGLLWDRQFPGLFAEALTRKNVSMADDPRGQSTDNPPPSLSTATAAAMPSQGIPLSRTQDLPHAVQRTAAIQPKAALAATIPPKVMQAQGQRTATPESQSSLEATRLEAQLQTTAEEERQLHERLAAIAAQRKRLAQFRASMETAAMRRAANDNWQHNTPHRALDAPQEEGEIESHLTETSMAAVEPARILTERSQSSVGASSQYRHQRR